MSAGAEPNSRARAKRANPTAFPSGSTGAEARAARLSRSAVVWVAALAAAAALAWGARGRAVAVRARWPAEADVMYLPAATVLRRLSLGHTELAADLVAARTNVYFGTELVQKGPQRWLASYLKTAVDLDPRFHRLYLSGAAMLIYNGRRITTEGVLAATALIERGLGQFPDDWELWFQLGFNKFFELPKLAGEDDRRVQIWRQEGVEALRRATTFPDVPPWLPNLAARLLSRQGQEELAIKHLEQAYAVSSSPETREQIRNKLLLLKVAQLSARLDEERRRFEERLRAAGYPYAPEAFSVAAGPRHDRAVTLPR